MKKNALFIVLSIVLYDLSICGMEEIQNPKTKCENALTQLTENKKQFTFASGWNGLIENQKQMKLSKTKYENAVETGIYKGISQKRQNFQKTLENGILLCNKIIEFLNPFKEKYGKKLKEQINKEQINKEQINKEQINKEQINNVKPLNPYMYFDAKLTENYIKLQSAQKTYQSAINSKDIRLIYPEIINMQNMLEEKSLLHNNFRNFLKELKNGTDTNYYIPKRFLKDTMPTIWSEIEKNKFHILSLLINDCNNYESYSNNIEPVVKELRKGKEKILQRTKDFDISREEIDNYILNTTNNINLLNKKFDLIDLNSKVSSLQEKILQKIKDFTLEQKDIKDFNEEFERIESKF